MRGRSAMERKDKNRWKEVKKVKKKKMERKKKGGKEGKIEIKR